jgi:thymidylate synthase (FAD)
VKISDIEVTPIHPERWGDDLDVVNAARVSFHKVSEEITPHDIKLINYLAKHKHHSPFNHTFISFRVKAPIFVARQLVKHKFMPWNEESRRYVDYEPEFYIPEHWRGRANNVKQGSSDEEVKLSFDYGEASTIVALNSYTNLLNVGVAPEQARMVLPQNAMTEWIWSGTLGAFLDMLVLRLDDHAQYETRLVAEKIAGYVRVQFPHSFYAYFPKA